MSDLSHLSPITLGKLVGIICCRHSTSKQRKPVQDTLLPPFNFLSKSHHWLQKPLIIGHRFCIQTLPPTPRNSVDALEHQKRFPVLGRLVLSFHKHALRAPSLLGIYVDIPQTVCSRFGIHHLYFFGTTQRTIYSSFKTVAKAVWTSSCGCTFSSGDFAWWLRNRITLLTNGSLGTWWKSLRSQTFWHLKERHILSQGACHAAVTEK